LWSNGTRPNDFEGGFAADEHFGALADADGQGVLGVGVKLAQTFFFDLQALVSSIEGHAELVRSRAKEALETHRVSSRVFAKTCGQEQLVIGEDREGAVADGRLNLDS
jgi:hypothetical protein